MQPSIVEMKNKTSITLGKIAYHKGLQDMDYSLKDQDLENLLEIHDFVVLIEQHYPNQHKDK